MQARAVSLSPMMIVRWLTVALSQEFTRYVAFEHAKKNMLMDDHTSMTIKRQEKSNESICSAAKRHHGRWWGVRVERPAVDLAFVGSHCECHVDTVSESTAPHTRWLIVAAIRIGVKRSSEESE